MSTSIHDGHRPPLALTPLPGLEPLPLFPVDHRLVVSEPPSLQDILGAAGVHDASELAVLAGAVRSVLAA